MIPITKTIIGKEEINSVAKVLKSGYIVKGKYVEEVESFLAGKFRRKYALMLTSGTISLNTSLAILGLNKNDEIITSAFTFVASATCIPYIGAKLVLADIDPKTFNIDPKDIERKITKKTKAIIAIDLFGNPFEYLKIQKIAKKYNLYLIEDAAQAHGAFYNGKPTGSLGDISIFSFYGSKIITSGEGGMLLTDNKKFYEKAQAYRAHGESKDKKYYFTSLGYNFMPTEIQGALLLEQAKKLEVLVKARRKAANYYSIHLKNIPGIITPYIEEKNQSSYSVYTIRITKEFGNRDAVLNYLNSKGVGARVYYPVPLHMQPIWKSLGYIFHAGQFPEAELASKEVISLPIFPGITKKDQNIVINSIKSSEDY